MKRITRKKLKRSLQCTLSLLLAALMLSGTAFASGGSAVTDLFDRMNKLVSATSKDLSRLSPR